MITHDPDILKFFEETNVPQQSTMFLREIVTNLDAERQWNISPMSCWEAGNHIRWLAANCALSWNFTSFVIYVGDGACIVLPCDLIVCDSKKAIILGALSVRNHSCSFRHLCGYDAILSQGLDQESSKTASDAGKTAYMIEGCWYSFVLGSQ